MFRRRAERTWVPVWSMFSIRISSTLRAAPCLGGEQRGPGSLSGVCSLSGYPQHPGHTLSGTGTIVECWLVGGAVEWIRTRFLRIRIKLFFSVRIRTWQNVGGTLYKKYRYLVKSLHQLRQFFRFLLPFWLNFLENSIFNNFHAFFSESKIR